MATTPRGIALTAKITALTGMTSGQKAQIQKIVEIIDGQPRAGELDYDLQRVYDALNGLT